MSIEFEFAKCIHLNELLAAEKICFPNEHWSSDNIKSELDNERARCIILRTNGDFSGYIFFSIICDECELNRIAVLPDYRNKKVGKMLIEKMSEICFENSVNEIFLEVRNGNFPAINLYSNAGFQKIGVRKKYYKNPIEDAVLMSLKLI